MTSTLVMDIDGTICFDGLSVEARIVDALNDAREAGWQLVFASARPVRDQAGVLAGHFPDAIRIGANGAMAATDGQIQVFSAFEKGQRDAILRALAEADARFVADGVWDYAHNLAEEHVFLERIDSERHAMRVCLDDLDSILKLVVVDHDDAAGLTAALVLSGCAVVTHRGEPLIDVAPTGVDKSVALVSLGIDEYIAFGNDLNDRRLLAGAEYAVGVGASTEISDVTQRRVPVDAGAVAASIRGIVSGHRPRG